MQYTQTTVVSILAFSFEPHGQLVQDRTCTHGNTVSSVTFTK